MTWAQLPTNSPQSCDDSPLQVSDSNCYAPSPTTCGLAIDRANQLRLKSLIWQIQDKISVDSSKFLIKFDEQLAKLRLLASVLRKLNYNLNHQNQIDLIECLSKIIVCNQQSQDDNNHDDKTNNNHEEDNIDKSSEAKSWPLVALATQLLADISNHLSPDIINNNSADDIKVLNRCVKNLGSPHGQLRRSALLLINSHFNSTATPVSGDTLDGHNKVSVATSLRFKRALRAIVDCGLNSSDIRVQRGAILALPLLLSKQLVKREQLGELVESLANLLTRADSTLFYSVYLALQRLHLSMGERKFNIYLRNFKPTARRLYAQATSRHGSMCESTRRASVSFADEDVFNVLQQDINNVNSNEEEYLNDQKALSDLQSPEPHHQQHQQQQKPMPQSNNQIFEPNDRISKNDTCQRRSSHYDESLFEEEHANRHNELSNNKHSDISQNNKKQEANESEVDDSSSEISADSDDVHHKPRVNRNSHLSSVSSTSSSHANLVNPSHYMPQSLLSIAANNKENAKNKQRELDDYFKQIHAHQNHADSSRLSMAVVSNGISSPAVEVGPDEGVGVAGQAAGGNNFDDKFNTNYDSHDNFAGSNHHAHELKFGIFSRQLVQAALNARVGVARIEALHEMMCCIRESPINHLAVLVTYFNAFLDSFVAKLIVPQSSNLHLPIESSKHKLGNNTRNANIYHLSSGEKTQIQLIGLDMLETIVVKTKAAVLPFVRPIVALLIKALNTCYVSHLSSAPSPQQHLSDSSTRTSGQITTTGANNSHNNFASANANSSELMIRESVSRLSHKLMAYLPPQQVLNAFFEFKHHKFALIRAEIVNRVTSAVLQFDKSEFNLIKLCYNVLPMLADSESSVRLASLECIASLAYSLGTHRIGSLLTAAEAVQTGCEFDGLLDAIHARLMRRSLPKANADGSVKPLLAHLLASEQLRTNNFGFGNNKQLAADLIWILEAPASHQHLQLRLESSSSNTASQQQHEDEKETPTDAGHKVEDPHVDGDDRLSKQSSKQMTENRNDELKNNDDDLDDHEREKKPWACSYSPPAPVSVPRRHSISASKAAQKTESTNKQKVDEKTLGSVHQSNNYHQSEGDSRNNNYDQHQHHHDQNNNHHHNQHQQQQTTTTSGADNLKDKRRQSISRKLSIKNNSFSCNNLHTSSEVSLFYQ